MEYRECTSYKYWRIYWYLDSTVNIEKKKCDHGQTGCAIKFKIKLGPPTVENSQMENTYENLAVQNALTNFVKYSH